MQRWFKRQPYVPTLPDNEKDNIYNTYILEKIKNKIDPYIALCCGTLNLINEVYLLKFRAEKSLNQIHLSYF